MKLKFIITSLLAVTMFTACNKLKDDFNNLLDNPNSPTPASADVDLYLNAVQLSFPGFVENRTNDGEALTRMVTFFGPTYTEGYFPQNFDGVWSTAYTSILKNVDALIPVAQGQKRFTHVGIAKIIKAYTFMTLVDNFGDVPYSEANQGAANTNPNKDGGKQVYDACIALLQSAVTDLTVTPVPPAPANDLYYAGNRTNWRALAKVLLFRAYMQTRLVDATVASKIDLLLADADIAAFKDFEFRYGTKSLAPDSRSPKYANNYTAQGSNDYLGNYFMWSLVIEKGIIDPRTRYYIYRQTNNSKINALNPVTKQFTVPCLFRSYPSNYPPGTPFCIVGDGYLGRDHGNGEGIPPDNQFRATWGVYPAGGRFDADEAAAVKVVDGGQGQGIQVIFLASFIDFLRAEYLLTVKNDAAAAKTAMLAGIDKSFTKVLGFPATVNTTASIVPTTTQINAYKTAVGSAYDAGATAGDKLNVIMKEYYLATWGNGIEPYNAYRRTGKPSGMQPVIQSNPGTFIRSFFYPSNYVNLNKNATQKPDMKQRVFWDNNPVDGFIF